MLIVTESITWSFSALGRCVVSLVISLYSPGPFHYVQPWATSQGLDNLANLHRYALVISMISMSNPSESESKKVPCSLDIWPNQKNQNCTKNRRTLQNHRQQLECCSLRRILVCSNQTLRVKIFGSDSMGGYLVTLTLLEGSKTSDQREHRA